MPKVQVIQPKKNKGWFTKTIQEKSDQLRFTSFKITQVGTVFNDIETI